MDTGAMMFLGMVIGAMAVFALTLFAVAWMTNRQS